MTQPRSDRFCDLTGAETPNEFLELTYMRSCASTPRALRIWPHAQAQTILLNEGRCSREKQRVFKAVASIREPIPMGYAD